MVAAAGRDCQTSAHRWLQAEQVLTLGSLEDGISVGLRPKLLNNHRLAQRLGVCRESGQGRRAAQRHADAPFGWIGPQGCQRAYGLAWWLLSALNLLNTCATLESSPLACCSM